MHDSVTARAIVLWLVASLTAGCSTVSYYSQAVEGHVDILRAARPIDELLADSGTSVSLKERLIQVKQIRAFASSELGLPDNASYQTYADIKRSFAVWNVFATPELSLKLMEWCHPVTGCVAYRGYYSKEAADAYANQLHQRGWDVQVSGVPAYSTLGYTSDPVLSTFINQPEGEVARLIFHELAHQLIYVPGDSAFNESFATVVEEEGVKRWLAHRDNPVLTESYRLYSLRKKTFLSLLAASREQLESVYANATSVELAHAAKKKEFDSLRKAYAQLKNDALNPLYGYTGYDAYFAQELNNAHLAAIATYTQWVSAFAQLMQQAEGDLPKFYRIVKGLAASASADRHAYLQTISPLVKMQADSSSDRPADRLSESKRLCSSLQC